MSKGCIQCQQELIRSGSASDVYGSVSFHRSLVDMVLFSFQVKTQSDIRSSYIIIIDTPFHRSLTSFHPLSRARKATDKQRTKANKLMPLPCCRRGRKPSPCRRMVCSSGVHVVFQRHRQTVPSTNGDEQSCQRPGRKTKPADYPSYNSQ